MGNKLPLNCILSFCKEQIPEHGEDSFCYAFCDTAGLVAVFDGCGGAGAQKHSCYGGHSEAYVASRLCAGVVYDDFCREFPTELPVENFVRKNLTTDLKQILETYAPTREEGSFQIRGSLVRTLPTTAAMAIIRPDGQDTCRVSAVWAGDSRVYILDRRGLAQLTVDDTTVPDPLENLYEDGVLKNVLCMDRPVRLHCVDYSAELPFMVFAATDGCFNYVSTPMEFEAMILSSLQQSSSVDQWEKNLAAKFGAVAGDDYTLCMAAYGYESFEALRRDMAERWDELDRVYLEPLSRLSSDDRTGRRALWEKYSQDYCRYLKDVMQDGNAG